jgi:CheY-like chemotaxis protein
MRVDLPVEASGDSVAGELESDAGNESEEHEAEVLEGLDVLVVEDDPEAIEMMQIVLADRGARVRTAQDYDSALAALHAAWPDVMVSDIGLPGKDGYELVRRVRELEAGRGVRLPVIALTAFARAEDRVKTLAAGFDLHLGKPLKPHLLLEAIARCRQPSGNPSRT